MLASLCVARRLDLFPAARRASSRAWQRANRAAIDEFQALRKRQEMEWLKTMFGKRIEFKDFVCSALSKEGLEQLRRVFPSSQSASASTSAIATAAAAAAPDFDERVASVLVPVPFLKDAALAVKEGGRRSSSDFELMMLTPHRFDQLIRLDGGTKVLVGAQGVGKSTMIRMLVAARIAMDRPFVLLPRFGAIIQQLTSEDKPLAMPWDDLSPAVWLYVARGVVKCVDVEKHVMPNRVEAVKADLEAALDIAADPTALKMLYSYTADGELTAAAIEARAVLERAFESFIRLSGVLYIVDEHNELFELTDWFKAQLREAGETQRADALRVSAAAGKFVSTHQYPFQYVFSGSAHSGFHRVMSKNGHFDIVASYMRLLDEEQVVAAMLGRLPTGECAAGSETTAPDLVSRPPRPVAPSPDRRLSRLTRIRSIADGRERQAGQAERCGEGEVRARSVLASRRRAASAAQRQRDDRRQHDRPLVGARGGRGLRGEAGEAARADDRGAPAAQVQADS